MNRNQLLRKFFGCLLMICIVTGLGAQEWAPVGAKWHYTTKRGGGSEGLLVIESVGDTIISGNTCRELKFSDISIHMSDAHTYYWKTITSSEYFYYNSDSVNHYDKVNEYFYTLYNFSINAGDTIIVRNEESSGTIPYSNFEYNVDSTKLLDFSGTQLRQFFITPSEKSDWIYAGPGDPMHSVIENIGSTLSFLGISLNDYLADWGGPIYLRCYVDANISYHSEIWPQGYTCEYLPLSIQENTADEISILPNPFNDYLTIRSQSAIPGVLKIFNIYGEALYEENLLETKEFDFGFLAPGIYIFQVERDGYPVFVKRIIKL